MPIRGIPREIDLKCYPRRAHFEYFLSLSNPYVGVTVNVDIRRLMERRRERNLPFFLTLLYCASRAANDVPELRQRIRAGGIVEYDWCPSSHTVAKPDGTYAYCALKADMPLDRFLPNAIRAQEACRRDGNLAEEGDALPYLFVSCIPWLSYTALIQPTSCPADSNPRITWGRRFEEGGRVLLPMSLLCHHALVDGLHLSRFYDALYAEMDVL